MQSSTLDSDKSTAIVKYYKPDTCYDGLRDNENKKAKFRRYPDEYLIAHLLQKYLAARFEALAATNRKIMVLTESWSQNGGDRDGGSNTSNINKLIHDTINELQESEDEDTLILVPFLYRYHHPGIAIDLKNKQAIYVDPFGSNQSSNYRETTALISELITRGFKVKKLLTPQQQKGIDGTSCGPILTNTMFRFIEEYIENGYITTDGFQGPRKKLATDRMFQMYVNNTIEYKDNPENIHEIMLADTLLWQAFLNENPILADEKLSPSIITEFKHHHSAIQKIGSKRNPTCSLVIEAIQLLQSRITECILLSTLDNAKQLSQLIEISKAMRGCNELAQLNELIVKLRTQTSLFNSQHFAVLQQQLRLNPPVESAPSVSIQPISPIMNSPFARLRVISEPPRSLQHMGSSSQLLDSNDSRSEKFFAKHYLLATFLKWSFSGLVAAGAFYFTFGFAVVPFVGTFLAQQGLYAVPLVGAILATTGGLAWNGFRALYRHYVGACFAQPQQSLPTEISEEIDFGDGESSTQSPVRHISSDVNPIRKSPPASPKGNSSVFWSGTSKPIDDALKNRSAFEHKH